MGCCIVMKIAVCDDEQVLRENILSLIITHHTDSCVDLYESGNALLDSGKHYDIYFLDIQMPGIDGLKTAEQIREEQKSLSSKESIIIFITAFKDHMLDAFDVKAFHYLIKPISEAKFKVVLSKAVNDYNRTNKDADRYILVKNGDSHHKIVIKDILYVESQGKKVIVHSDNGVLDYYGKMQELEKILGNSFFRSHRCYIVNMEHITRYSANAIGLKNGNEVLLAQKKFQEFVKTYMNFARGGGLIDG